jgi:hypothetical protein
MATTPRQLAKVLLQEGNMSYCRFNNTMLALRDCEAALDDGEATDAKLDEGERQAKRWLISTCADIVDKFSANLGNVEHEEEEGSEPDEQPQRQRSPWPPLLGPRPNQP